MNAISAEGHTISSDFVFINVSFGIDYIVLSLEFTMIYTNS